MYIKLRDNMFNDNLLVDNDYGEIKIYQSVKEAILKVDECYGKVYKIEEAK